MKNISVNSQLFSSALWSVLSRWSMKAVGLVNTVILARLLSPDDFGVVAMASLVVGVLYSFSELGVQTYLIRERNVDSSLCNTAWTLQIIQYCLIALLLILLAPYAAIYFDENRVVPIIYFFALSSFIEGFCNIGTVFFLKELNFSRDFLFNLSKRLLVFIITLIAAIKLKNYWALVIGQVFGATLGVVLSYLLHGYRPSFSLARYRDLLKFSLAMIPINIGVYLNNKVDVLLAGRIADTALLGGYNMASELSGLFTRELIYPIGRGLFPNFAKIKDNVDELALAYMDSFKFIVLISFPLGFGMFTIANDFVLVVLGGQWDMVAPYLKWLSFYATLECLIQLMNGRILVVTGNEAFSALFMWFRLIVIASSAIFFIINWGISSLPFAMFFAVLILFPFSVVVLSKSIKVPFFNIVQVFVSPLFGSLIMMETLIETPFDHWISQPLIRMFSESFVGAIVYIFVVYLVWFINGRPDGVERMVLGFIQNKIFI